MQYNNHLPPHQTRPMTTEFESLFQAATQFHQASQWAEAEAAYRQALVFQPQQPDVLHLLGVLLFQTGRAQESIELISQAIQQRPEQAAFHCNLGVVLQSVGHYEQAIDHYLRAESLQEGYVQALYNLGFCYFQLGQSQQAEGYYQRVLALQPDDAQVLLNLAQVYRQRGWIATAADHLELALKHQPENPDGLMQLSELYGELGRLTEGLDILKRLLEREPTNALLHNAYGLLSEQNGEHEQAILSFRRAIELNPSLPSVYINLGTVLLEQDHPQEALELYQEALRLQPENPRIYLNIATAYRKLGESFRAFDYYHVAIGLNPDYSEAYRSLATLLAERGKKNPFGQGRVGDSLKHLSMAVGRKPDFAEGYFQAGCLLLDLVQSESAIRLFEEALAHKPDYALAYNNMGIAYRILNKPEQEELQYRQALTQDPELAEAYCNLGLMLYNQHRYDEALPILLEAAYLKPDFLDVHRALGSTYKGLNRLAEAVASFERALEINPEDPATYAGLAGTYLQQCRHQEAIQSYRKSAKLAPGVIAFHGNILMGLHYAPDFDPEETYREHKKWGDAYQASVVQYRRPYHRDRDLKRPLRIGYISGDFKLHSVSLFFEHVYNHHDHEQFQIHCYSNVPKPDVVTERMREKADVWHDISKISSDFDVATLIHEDKVDILVDLAGHTGYSRLQVLALKPAPIQATYLGYPNTTGLSLVDYRITDSYADPPALTDGFHTEKLIRLPKSFLCYNPIDAFPQVSELPALSSGVVTFGCCNNPTKITPNVIEVWSNILRQLPQSRLLLKNQRYTDSSVREIFWNYFESYGVGRDQVVLVGDRQGFTEHFQIYNEMDIGLDPFPYNGTTTTCETLWGGVPVVVLAGNAHVCRVGVSILSNVGLPDLIGETPDDYVQIAVDLARDLPRLRELRHNLRSLMEASPLRDPQAHARALERAYRQMWRNLVVSGH